MKITTEVQEAINAAIAGGFGKIHLAPLSDTRKNLESALASRHPTPVAKVVDLEVTAARIPVRLYIPAITGTLPCIVYCHGGGFSFLSINTHDELCRQLCMGSKAVVMSVGYRLAPEHKYPAGPDDCFNAATWLFDHAGQYHGDSSRIGIAGDSAGGCLALLTAQRLTDQGYKLKAQFTAYPITDHYSGKHTSYKTNEDGYTLSYDVLKWCWDNYVSDPAKFEDASPLRKNNLKGLPASMIFTCDFDPIRDEGKAYADRLVEAGVPVDYRNYINIHGFLGTGDMGKEALADACRFFREHL